MTTDARLTAQDLIRLGGDDVRRELVNGRVIEMPPRGRSRSTDPTARPACYVTRMPSMARMCCPTW